MKIGFSLGRCIRDIVNGTVDIDDVVVIVTGTLIRDQEHLKGVVSEYMWRQDYLQGLDEAECQGVASVLWREGKFHQPRALGGNPPRVREMAVWGDLVPTGGFEDPMIQDAWQAYRSMLGLTGNAPDKQRVENDWKR
jgi:hypothetical protein